MQTAGPTRSPWDAGSMSPCRLSQLPISADEATPPLRMARDPQYGGGSSHQALGGQRKVGRLGLSAVYSEGKL